MNRITPANLESTFQSTAAMYPTDNLDERDFNKLLEIDFYIGKGKAFMLQMAIFDEVEPEEVLHGELKSIAEKFGFEQHTNNWDASSRRFNTIPKRPRSADELFDPLVGIMNKALQGAGGRGNVVYFNPPLDLRRKRKDGKPWMKTDLNVVNYASMMKFRAEKAKRESKAKAQQSKAGPSKSLKIKGKKIEPPKTLTAEDYDMLITSSAIVLTEVCLDSNIEESRDILLAYAKENLCIVPNRLFLFCVLFTQSVMEVYSVDRMGIYSRTTIHYHQDPMRFGMAVIIFADIERVKAQFDKSLRMGDRAQAILRVYDLDDDATVVPDEEEKLKTTNYNISAMIFAEPAFLDGIYEKAAKHPLSPSMTNQIPVLRQRYYSHQRYFWINNTAPVRHPSEQPRLRLQTELKLTPQSKKILDFENQKEFLKLKPSSATDVNSYLDSMGVMHGEITPGHVRSRMEPSTILQCEIER